MLALRERPLDHLEVASEVMRAEELLLHAALGRESHLLGALVVSQQVDDRRPNLLEVARIRQQHAGSAVLDLVPNAADSACDDGPPFPHRFGDRQAEPLGEALLHHHACVALQGVDNRRILLDIFHRQ